MIKVKCLRAKNVIYLTDVTLPFVDQLTFIRGVNADSGRNPTSNAVGKTLLFNCLPNVWYQTQPLAVNKNNKKEMLSRKGAQIEVEQEHDGSLWTIKQTQSKYVFLKDGVDQKIRTAKLQKEKLQELFPLSDIEFYTYGWLSTQRPFPFQMGKDLDRLNYLVEMFRLDQYEPIRLLAARRLKAVKDNEIRVSVLISQIKELEGKVKELESQHDVKVYKKAKAQFDALEAQKEEVSRRIGELASELLTLRKLLEIEKELDSYRKQYTHKAAPKERRKQLREERKLLEQYERYLHLKKSYDKQSKTLTAQLQEIKLPSKTIKQLQADLESLDSKRSKLSVELESQQTLAEQYADLSSEYKAVHKKFKALNIAENTIPKDIAEKLAEAEVTLRLQKLLDHDHEDGKCPMCMSDIDIDAIGTMVQKAKKTKAKYLKFQEANKLLTSMKDITAQLAKLCFDERRTSELEEEIKKLKARSKSVSASIDDARRHKHISEQLAALEKPEAPDYKPELELDHLEEELELCDNIIHALSAREALGAKARKAAGVQKEIKETQKELDTLNKKSSALSTDQSDASDLLNKYKLNKGLLEKSKEDLEKLQAEKATLSRDLPSKRALEALVKAYGPKGLRTLAADSICSILEQNLNLYRDLVFHEPYIFSLRASESGLSIMVDRGNGFKSDVRTLSGAESNAYRLLFLIAVLPLIPDSRKLNFVLLDEPTSHQHAVTRQLVTERYLPVLRQLVPNVFFISNVGDHAPDSRELFLVKQGGSTRLTKTPVLDAPKSAKRRPVKQAKPAARPRSKTVNHPHTYKS